MKFSVALGAVLAATASAVRFESYPEPNYEGGAQVFVSLPIGCYMVRWDIEWRLFDVAVLTLDFILNSGWFYLTPVARSYKFDSEGGKYAIKAPTGSAAFCDGDTEVADTGATLGTVEVGYAADMC
ncbi:uncharacterized protein DSM5745_11232 [Aspergillus mulundensis]|uniref:Uncharacterized protein n=1 Tax=Aspergillus mulundensis TaxID=1810919 RepID=A0A3D8Q9T6_9EURO|nr:hypothetical protein DSM5745_11232 [Aspergillus mulundensis]RDW58541.1 hypothetical protein DSM5745_11232 [Aspergillus mulundensis]